MHGGAWLLLMLLLYFYFIFFPPAENKKWILFPEAALAKSAQTFISLDTKYSQPASA